MRTDRIPGKPWAAKGTAPKSAIELRHRRLAPMDRDHTWTIYCINTSTAIGKGRVVRRRSRETALLSFPGPGRERTRR